MNHPIRYKTDPEKQRGQAGFTLAEFLVATLILLVLVSAVFKLLSELQRTAGYQAEVQTVLNNTRIAMQTAERYIRQAGNDPLDIGFSGVTIISATEVQIRLDRTGSKGAGKGDPDGDVDDPGENITIRYNTRTRSLEIVPRRGPAQIVANYISDFSMKYYSAEGNPTTSGNLVCRVEVTIFASTLHADPITRKPFGVKLTRNIRVLA
jgi:prepilin-type N-terminal cleavage/methylation domain-containing protein